MNVHTSINMKPLTCLSLDKKRMLVLLQLAATYVVIQIYNDRNR